MKWINANKKLPEFKNRDQVFVCRYILSHHPYELWDWDTINNRQAASYEFEWLDESIEGGILEKYRGDFQAFSDRILRDKGASNKDVYDAINDTIEELSKHYDICLK